jgi:hypothetical protein
MYMNVDEVKKVSQRLEEFSQTLKTVSDVLKGAIQLLNDIAFIGLFGSYILARFLEVIQPQIEAMSKNCLKTKEYVDGEVKEWLAAQQSG